jgi:glycosyltransferase involved in cell wall biosynthesis
MRILVISRSWTSDESSGVSLIASEHVRMLLKAGHVVSIAGSYPSVLKDSLEVLYRFHIPSKGSGSLYSPSSVDVEKLKIAIEKSKAELIICEAWQTALTDRAIDIAYEMNVPVLMVSHGVSVHAFKNGFLDFARAILWFYYKCKKLPTRISRLAAITTLDEYSDSSRFYDRDIAKIYKIPIKLLVNSPINWRESILDFNHRKRKIIVIGYFSMVKNQLAALDLLASLPKDIELTFIGRKVGSYYFKCLKRVTDLGLNSRVKFLQDDECVIADEIANSIILLSTSITEALPVNLLEAMACGTPFVATSVGAIPSIGAGIIADNSIDQRNAILSLVNNFDYWTNLSQIGYNVYRTRYSQDHVRKSLLDAVETATKNVIHSNKLNYK